MALDRDGGTRQRWHSHLAADDDQAGTLHTRPGYGDVTGGGTPDGARSIARLGR